jgi:raffinose/stachyose/melibiose transport system permease protein
VNQRTETTSEVGSLSADGTATVPSALGVENRPTKTRLLAHKAYPHSFYIPAAIVYAVLFIVPTGMAFFFSLTRWTLFDWEFIGLDNYQLFFSRPALITSMRNTLVYAVVTSGLKVVFGLLLAVLFTSRIRLKTPLRSIVFLPVLISTVAVGITFKVLMHPSEGLINKTIALIGAEGPAWLTDPQIALLSIALVDVWKGVGIALVIFIAGIVSIPEEYTDAVRIDGGAWAKFRHVIVPLSRNATFTVIILSLVGGLRSFDLIWTMTGGGPGFTTDVIASAIFKQYQAGFYGLSTAGNVLLFIAVSIIVFPLMRYFNRKELDL